MAGESGSGRWTVMQLECPWCGVGMELEGSTLPAHLRCAECATVVDVADGDAVERVLAA